jgi:hypothetical protein
MRRVRGQSAGVLLGPAAAKRLSSTGTYQTLDDPSYRCIDLGSRTPQPLGEKKIELLNAVSAPIAVYHPAGLP